MTLLQKNISTLIDKELSQQTQMKTPIAKKPIRPQMPQTRQALQTKSLPLKNATGLFLLGLLVGIAGMYALQRQHLSNVSVLERSTPLQTASSSPAMINPKVEYPSKQEKPIFDENSPLV